MKIWANRTCPGLPRADPAAGDAGLQPTRLEHRVYAKDKVLRDPAEP